MTEPKNGGDPVLEKLDQILEILAEHQQTMEEIVEKLIDLNENGTGFTTEFES